MSEPSPIALFVYARPTHSARTIESLKANAVARESELFVFADGPRTEELNARVVATRAIVREACDTGFRRVEIVEREHNLGLAGNIVAGVSRLCASHGRVIVVEDDLLLSPHFLEFMNDGLRMYEAEERVASIHGYCFPADQPLPDTFFLKGADCWGWATWARAWAGFDSDGQRLRGELARRNLDREFDLGGAYPYTRMLESQIAGANDSWAIRWHASCFLNGMVTLHPGRSLVLNIGNDATGTHCRATDSYNVPLSSTPIRVERLQPDASPEATAAFRRSMRRSRSLAARARDTLIAWRRALA